MSAFIHGFDAVIVVYFVVSIVRSSSTTGMPNSCSTSRCCRSAVSDDRTTSTPSAERCVVYSARRRSWTIELSDWKTMSE